MELYRKDLLAPGTYFDKLSEHVGDIDYRPMTTPPSGTRPDEVDAPVDVEHLPEFGEWLAAISVSDQASGEWLLSKFNLRDKQTFETYRAGAARRGRIQVIADREDDDHVGDPYFDDRSTCLHDRSVLSPSAMTWASLCSNAPMTRKSESL